MEIRFAVSADIPGMIELLRQVGEVHHQGRPDLFRAGAQKYDESALTALLQDRSRPIFVAVEGNTVLGYGFCQITTHSGDPVMTDHTTLYIDDLCVHEDCRGQHVGQAIFRHIRDYAGEQGFHNITLNAWTCNPTAIKFYEKMGMTPQKIGMELVL